MWRSTTSAPPCWPTSWPILRRSLRCCAFPAWDCLPYDRVSPVADIVARRLATLARLLEPVTKPTVLLTTVNAVLQRVVPRGLIAGADLLRRTGQPRQLATS